MELRSSYQGTPRAFPRATVERMFASDLIRDKPWAEGLNQEQSAAVHHDGGPLLVVAGAGSGKTRTLVARVARLIDTGVPAERILLLTFTRRASSEMLRRVDHLEMTDVVAVVGVTVGLAGRLIGVEHHPDAPVPDGVGVHLDAPAIEPGDVLVELLLRVERLRLLVEVIPQVRLE